MDKYIDWGNLKKIWFSRLHNKWYVWTIIFVISSLPFLLTAFAITNNIRGARLESRRLEKEWAQLEQAQEKTYAEEQAKRVRESEQLERECLDTPESVTVEPVVVEPSKCTKVLDSLEESIERENVGKIATARFVKKNVYLLQSVISHRQRYNKYCVEEHGKNYKLVAEATIDKIFNKQCRVVTSNKNFSKEFATTMLQICVENSSTLSGDDANACLLMIVCHELGHF